MNGSSTRLEPADASSQSDPIEQRRDACTTFRDAAKKAAQIGEWKLQREATDAADRAEGWIREEELQQRRVDGQNPQAAREEEG